jgi:TolB protein
VRSIDVGCLNETTPCIGKQKGLFRVEFFILDIGWSSDGQRVAFVGEKNKVGDLYVANADGKKLKKITNNADLEFSPDWSPDDSQIAFSSCKYEGCQIYSTSPDGKEFLPLVTFEDVKGLRMGDWSPYGNRIIFEGDDYSYGVLGVAQLFYVNIDGSEIIQLTDTELYNFSPSFSPDGEWITLIRETSIDAGYNTTDDVYVMRANGTQEINITNDNAKQFYPRWAPKGDWILFYTELEDRLDIELIKPDGTHRIKILEVTDKWPSPAWRTITEP